jgi:hypothetical protein
MRQAVLAVLFVGLCSSAYAESAKPMAIEVFPFELEDKSAGAGIIEPDDYDKRYLSEAAQVMKDMLAQSGRYSLVEVPTVDSQPVAPHGLRNCGGCEGKIAKDHGASLALLGVVTRINRTEHTLFIRILDVDTGQPVAMGFTDLRMGANHAWPRSAKWVMKNRILQ